MKKDRFIARLAKRTVATTVAGACLAPQLQSAQPEPRAIGVQVATVEVPTLLRSAENTSNSSEHFILAIAEPTTEWTPALEREFRRLALLEASGTINEAGMRRLEHLNGMRDRLLDPLPPEVLLLQLKRDRVLEKMAEALREYVKFHEVANQARSATR